MMRLNLGFALLSSVALLSACDGAGPVTNTSEASNNTSEASSVATKADPRNQLEGAPCIPLNASQWSAWIDTMPGTEGPTLHVKGVGIVYRKDWTVTLTAGELDKTAPPSQHVHITTISSGSWSPKDPPIEVPVDIAMPAPKDKLGAVVVDCRSGLELVRITDIKTTS
jgi:hypothetical protein